MKILIPSDVKGMHSSNPYDVQLIKGLENSGCEVDHGLFRLNDYDKHYDIISFQWPEYILPGNPPSEYEFKQFENRIKKLKLKSIIVSTIHNEVPHNMAWADYQQIYRIIYKYSDGFIHFGEKSIEIINSQFASVLKNKDHIVIPHGNYTFFGDRINRKYAKKKLGFSDQVVVLHVGSIRKLTELRSIHTAAQLFSKMGSNFVIQSQVNIPRINIYGGLGSVLKRIKQEILIHGLIKRINRVRGVSMNEKKVPFEKMATFVSAADILFIARVDSLNSGNVPLGFTYGCVVIGPNIGNIGEILSDNNNPVYVPSKDNRDLIRAVKKSLSAVQNSIGENNYHVAKNDWDWTLIGLKQKKFFEYLLSKRKLL